MNRLIRFLSSFALFLPASCDLWPPVAERPAMEESCRVEFSVRDPQTRATGISSQDEERIVRWALYVFSSSGELVATGTSPSAGGITVTVPAGICRACAAVNYPTAGTGAFDPSSFSTEQALEAKVAYLADNAPDEIEMYGSDTFSLTAGTSSKTIRVERLLSKVVVKKVTVRMADDAPAAQPFTLDGIWIDNVPSRTTFGADCPPGQLGAARQEWYNTMDWHAAGSCTFPACPDALLGERAVGAVIPQNGSHTAEHRFYVTPNATEASSDSRSPTWSKRCTRLVMQATVGTKTTYYTVTLPSLRRNNSYTIDEAVITRLGSDDPEQEIPGAVELVFSTSDPSWDGPVSVTEDS